MAGKEIIKTTAFNWTEKIDYSSGYKLLFNTQLPKSYVFTYKDDSDYANADYKNSYAQAYGTFTSLDSLGIGATQTISLIFSPTPVITYLGTQRIFPGLFTGIPDVNRKPFKSNIRIFAL